MDLLCNSHTHASKVNKRHISEIFRSPSLSFMFFSDLANCLPPPPFLSAPVDLNLFSFSRSARAPCRRLSVIPMTNATKEVSDREQSLYWIVFCEYGQLGRLRIVDLFEERLPLDAQPLINPITIPLLILVSSRAPRFDWYFDNPYAQARIIGQHIA